MKKTALTIAGSDPSSGAGIQADLKTFSNLGLHGTTAITCITVQNTKQVKKIHPLPVEIIENQIDTIYEDTPPDAVKTGMLYNEEIVKSIAKKIKQYKMKPVVDPIMTATSGDKLIQTNFIDAFKKEILPKTHILTANIPEAIQLTGNKISTVDEIQNACKKLYHMGPKYVLIKGGHLKTKDTTDIFYDGKKITTFTLPRISTNEIHGTGCTHSALITGLLALGETTTNAVEKSKYIIWNMINKSYKPGKGTYILDLNQNIQIDIPPTFPTDEHHNIWFELKTAVEKLITILPTDYIPEVGTNFGYALPNAKTLADICAIDGRITKTKNQIVRTGGLNFNVSKHIASIILTATSFDKTKRSALNIKYTNQTLEFYKQKNFTIGSFDRKNEPKNTKSTMEWGSKQAITKLGFVPDVIYDTGGIGKEPMIRILGKDPEDIITKIKKLL